MPDLISIALLTAAKLANPEDNASVLQEAANRWGILTPARVEAWLAMLGVESAGLTRTSEDLYYTDATWLYSVFRGRFASVGEAQRFTRNPTALGNLVYASIGRIAGGYAARGLGWGQLTGDANHGAYAKAVGISLAEARANMLGSFGCADSAAWYFQARGCDVAADAGNLMTVRRLWTGCKPPETPLGWAEAEKWYGQVTSALVATATWLPKRPVAGHAAVPVHSTAPALVGRPATSPDDDAADILNQAQLDGAGSPDTST